MHVFHSSCILWFPRFTCLSRIFLSLTPVLSLFYFSPGRLDNFPLLFKLLSLNFFHLFPLLSKLILTRILFLWFSLPFYFISSQSFPNLFLLLDICFLIIFLTFFPSSNSLEFLIFFPFLRFAFASHLTLIYFRPTKSSSSFLPTSDKKGFFCFSSHQKLLGFRSKRKRRNF